MSTSKQHRPKRNPQVTVNTAPLPNFSAIESAFLRYVPLAQAIPEEQVEALGADPALCYQNVVLGVEAVLKYEQEIEKLPTRLSLQELKELPELALALQFAAMQVNRRSTGEVATLQKQASGLRRLLLDAAKMLVSSGDLQARDVEAIQIGRGIRDMAEDCIALSALFRKHETQRQKTAVTAAHVLAAGQTGTQLLMLVRPRGSHQPTRGAAAAAPGVAIRDRLWTLLDQQHRELRRIAMWLFMEDVDAHVPALRSRKRRALSASTAAAPAAPEGAEPQPPTS